MSQSSEMASGPASLPPDYERKLLAEFERNAHAIATIVARECAAHPELAAAIVRLGDDAMDSASTVRSERGGRPPPPLRVERPRQIGPFHILGEIGHGGMGSVYLAEQRDPVERRVALKVIKAGMDTERVLGRFELERQALARMEHAAIAKVLEAGATAEGRPYFAMEYVKGLPITRYCDENKLSVAERLRLFVDVCGGVQHAHHKGVIHRDLTPNNILVSVQDGKPAAKIIDFGLARATDRRLTEHTVYTEQGVIMGTPEYMSPEQAGRDGLDIDTRSDVYTLGVLLYELLTGKLPFSRAQLRDAGFAKMCEIIRTAEPDKPSTQITKLDGDTEAAAKLRRTEPGELLRLLRGDLDWVVLKCLEKDRTRRYQTVTALADDVERYLANRPIEARPPSLLYTLRKLARRHRGQLAAAAAVLAALVIGLVVAVYLWRRMSVYAAELEVLKTKAEQGAANEKSLRIRAENAEQLQRDKAWELEQQRNRAEAGERRLAASNSEVLELAAKVARGEEDKASLRLLLEGFEYTELIAQQDELWPASVHVAALRDWLQRAERALQRSADVVTTVRDIEARAEPLRDAQQQRDAEQHLAVLAGKVASLRRAQAVRTGAPELELPALTADERALRADHLNARAWDGVAPWPEKRKSYGDEPRCVALARLALDKVRAGDPSTTSDDVLETLMWALFGVGQNQQARAIGDQAVAAAGASVASKRRRSRRELERAIRDSLRTLEAAEAELQRAKLAVERPTAWRFANEQDAQLHASLEKQVAQRDALERDTIVAVRARLAWHEEEQKLLAQHAPAWDVARTAVAAADDKVANRRYASPRIDLPPLRGLVPLGMNPKTRLHEFYHPRSAAKPDVLPSRGDDGSFDVDDDTGLIFVLVPGGTFVMGAQNENAGERHFDPTAEKDEAPVHEVTIAPFLLSRFEMTQAQWLRLTGENPSQYPAATAPNLVRTITGANPVERVSWETCQKWLTRHGLLLPTEAQWEYACRAGTDTIWSCGDVPEDLVRFANLADITALGQPLKTEAWDDGHIVHAPVGSFAPNAFGCHDMHGNVSEWTLDLMRSYTVVPRPGDGLREGNPGAPVYRGGAWSDHATKVRSSQRFAYTADHGMPIVGVRPARVLR